MVRENYRIPAQPIPDIPDWREVCRDMQSKGVRFEKKEADGSGWFKSENGFSFTSAIITKFRIPAQPIPEWREDMIEELTAAKQEKPEVPHRALQIQWHQDCIYALKTGEPMREWEYNWDESRGWMSFANSEWSKDVEYRRKPRMKKVTYWHCVGVCADKVGKKDNVYLISGDLKDLEKEVTRHRKMYTTAKFNSITETTVEIPDHD